uniref:Uncharacterized protein n=1 Tax=Solanum lycopersicum TaxID=4081 RepID=A0A3Q7HNV0_SOLLC
MENPIVSSCSKQKKESKREKGVKLHFTPMQTFQKMISQIISNHKDFSNIRDIGKIFLMQSTMKTISFI